MLTPQVRAASGPSLLDPDQVIDAVLQRTNQLATLPAIALQTIRLTENPETTFEEMNAFIGHDPALGVRILKVVNSAYYGKPGQIDSVRRAIQILGFKAVKNIAVAASLTKLFRGGRIHPEFDAEDLWTHSIAVATATAMLANVNQAIAPDEAFLAGLIHDVGILIELQVFGQAFTEMIQDLTSDSALTFRMAEFRMFGISHEILGCALAKAWHFPVSLQHVTGHHHHPLDLPAEDRLLPGLVHVADIIVAGLGLGYARTVETKTVDPELMSFLGLTESSLLPLIADLPKMVKESESLWKAGSTS